MIPPLIVMAIGIALVIGLIMGLRVNAFIALLIAAITVSVLTLEPIVQAPGELPSAGELEGDSQKPQVVGYRLAGNAMTRVTVAFGEACGNIAIVIALAAVIGTCMMDSGAADRIVRAFMSLLGEKRAPWALMGSGYVLAIPVFFDTVFYLLVPLARSFYRRTGGAYLKCILAISAGGAITHTLVPPTPGPLTMAATLNIDLGRMILIGALVALPAAIAGIFCAAVLDKMFAIPMREVAGREEPDPLEDHQLPGLFVSLMPVVLPVLMIACHTAADSVAKHATGNTAAVGAEITNYTAVFGNPSFALLVSTIIALMVYVKQRRPTRDDVSRLVEMSLMSGGVIILITAAGSSFGAMLKQAGVGDSIREIAEASFGDTSTGTVMLFLGFGLASLLKISQGSSTAAMIIVSGMMAGIIEGTDLPYNTVYLATAIGSGSLVGSWMNDSGFWIFAKMGGLTEAEALKTWTPLLIILGCVGMGMTLLLASVMP
ncbi:MAG: SLC13 family permease [Pirellulaceae bacterium]